MSWTKQNLYGLSDRFQVRTQQEVFKFNQLDSGYNSYNESLWIQSERDELNYQLKTMFNEITEWVGYYPRPIWKKIKVPLDNFEYYYNEKIYIPESAYLNSLGVRATELIESGVTYTTSPLTGLKTVALFEVETDEIEDGELVLFHTANDSFGKSADERFRVLPSQVYYDGSSYQIEVPYARLIKPELWKTQFNNGDPEQRNGYSPTDTDNFVTSLDVYRVYTDSTIKGKLIGYPLDYSGSSELQSVNVNIVISDGQNSEFKIIANQESVLFEPTHVEVWCNIGKPLNENGDMESILEEFIIRKAKVEMGLNARLAEAKISGQWQYDALPAYTKTDVNSGYGGIGARRNPIGLRNVDVEMFKKLMPIANYRGKILDKRFWDV